MKGKHVVIMFALVVPLAGLLVWVNRPPEVAPAEFHPQASDLHTLWGGELATWLRAEPPNPPQLAHWIPVARQLHIYVSALPENASVCMVTEEGVAAFHDCWRAEDFKRLGREIRAARQTIMVQRAPPKN